MKEQENSSLWQETPQQNPAPARESPKENFFAGNGVSHFVDSESPLLIGLQTAPWPPKFKPVSLPKYNGFGNSRQFLMRYESAMNSAGGDDVALAKSFIIACEGPVLNWYSLLPPHSIYSWVDLKTKFKPDVPVPPQGQSFFVSQHTPPRCLCLACRGGYVVLV
jgi:hypothetical protein